MKKNSIIEIYAVFNDLPLMTENWKGEPFEERKEKIYATHRSFYRDNPSPRMFYARDIVFPVPPEVTLEQVVALIPAIRDRFVIECFQVAIDRQEGKCHMLFDWYDSKKGCVCTFQVSSETKFSRFLRYHLLDLHGHDGAVLPESVEQEPVTFQPFRCSHDLARTSEYWESRSYMERRYHFTTSYFDSHRRDPSSLIQFARAIVFPVPPEVTLEQVVALIPAIRDRFVIECFQVAIDRQEGKCNMLFDWYDYDQHAIHRLNGSQLVLMKNFITRKLDIIFTSEQDSSRSHLLIEYIEDNSVFQKAMQGLSLLTIPNKSRLLLYYSLKFAEQYFRKVSPYKHHPVHYSQKSSVIQQTE